MFNFYNEYMRYILSSQLADSIISVYLTAIIKMKWYYIINKRTFFVTQYLFWLLIIRLVLWIIFKTFEFETKILKVFILRKK